VLSRALNVVSETLFPARCLGCGRRGVALCLACRAELPYLPEGTCQRCATLRGPRGACRGCRQLSSSLRSLRAAFAYHGAARSAVLLLKFRSGRYLVPLMAEFLREALILRPVQVDIVIPVPLSVRRRRARGFNQATLLAQHVTDLVGAAIVEDALVRHDRPAQQTLPAAERLRNLDQAFVCVDPSLICGRRILLVDDVVTTGATLSACADTLAQAGARLIVALAFARDL
jgi:ComF family protein